MVSPLWSAAPIVKYHTTTINIYIKINMGEETNLRLIWFVQEILHYATHDTRLTHGRRNLRLADDVETLRLTPARRNISKSGIRRNISKSWVRRFFLWPCVRRAVLLCTEMPWHSFPMFSVNYLLDYIAYCLGLSLTLNNLPKNMFHI